MTVGVHDSLSELVRAGTRLSQEIEFSRLADVLVEQSLDISRSDLCALYLHVEPGNPQSKLRQIHKRGAFDVPSFIAPDMEWVEFLFECGEAVVVLENTPGPFQGVLIHPEMSSGFALPLSTATMQLGVLVLNARQKKFYNAERFHFLDSFSKLAGGLLHNARLFQELKEYLAKIEALERYQENIFASMTNLLVTTDKRGNLRYFNRSAQERLGLEEENIGKPIKQLWQGALDKKLVGAIEKAKQVNQEILGAEGIFRGPAGDIDFSLNVSPLKVSGPEANTGLDGTTFVFADQSREKELAGKVETVVEERRVIKDMFSRYLSADIVQALVDQPELVRPGGDSKVATVLFADIRGYTSFSEGRDPETIITILNEYFNEAVDMIIKSGGFIDKFIGDAIMAAWGVPISRDANEAANAVRAALSIQQAIASTQRKFFRGEAEKLRVGIGMHTGPLVAGNLGSDQRMDYTVIGDTVNIAARLEGVAKAGEVIITQNTRDHLGDGFVLEQREPVQVKGKSKPIPIYSVLGLAS